jgi:hypothetical protein
VDGRADRYLREAAEDVGVRVSLAGGARKALGPFIGTLRDWNCFFTGTYAPRKRPGAVERILGVDVHPRVSRWQALRDGERLVDFASELAGSPVAGVICVEPHLDRSYHLHGLLDLRGERSASLGVLTWRWSELHGFCRFDRPRDLEDVCRYSAKYLVGPESDIWFSPGLIC